MTHNPYAQFQQTHQAPPMTTTAPAPRPAPVQGAQPAPWQQPPPAHSQAPTYGAPPAQGAYPSPAASPYGAPPPAAYAPPPPAYAVPQAPPAPAYQPPPPPGYAQPQAAGWASAQEANADAGMNFLPRGVFGRWICRVDGFTRRISASRGSMGGPQRVLKLTTCTTNNPTVPVGATIDVAFRAGIAHGKAAEAVSKDLGRCKQAAAAAYRLGDPKSQTPPLPAGCVVAPGQLPWDAILDHLESHRFDQVPLFLEFIAADSGNPAFNPDTKQPLGYNYANFSFLPAPLPPGAG